MPNVSARSEILRNALRQLEELPSDQDVKTRKRQEYETERDPRDH